MIGDDYLKINFKLKMTETEDKKIKQLLTQLLSLDSTKLLLIAMIFMLITINRLI